MSTLNPIFQDQKAQKVEVVNELSAKIENSSANPLNVSFPSSLVGGSAPVQYLRVSDNNPQGAAYVKPIGTNAVSGFVSCVHVVNNNVGAVFPINQDFYNITTATTFETTIIPSLHSSFAQRFPSATSIIVFYSYQNSQRTYTFGAYSGE